MKKIIKTAEELGNLLHDNKAILSNDKIEDKLNKILDSLEKHPSIDISYLDIMHKRRWNNSFD